jgi:cysteine desulfurase
MYLDHNATTPPAREVLEAIFLAEPLNPSSIHSYGRRARAIMEEARNKIIKLFKVPKGFRVIFTNSATEANNLIMNSFDEVYASATEHPSILGGKIKSLIPVTREGLVTLQEISEGSLYAIMLANNETGVINPIKEIAGKIQANKAFLHVDAVQGPGKIPLDLSELSADSYSISAHKLGGVVGVGLLIYNQDKIPLKPIMKGGGQEYGLRPGTENIPAIRGLSVALDLLEARLQKNQENQKFRDQLELEIKAIAPEAIIFGEGSPRLPNTLSITMPGVKSEVQVAFFDSHGLAVSAGAACSAGRVEKPSVQLAMGYSYEEATTSLRISLGPNNKEEEIKFFFTKWQELYKKTRNHD